MKTPDDDDASPRRMLRRSAVLALVSAAASAACLPPFDCWPLAAVAWAPLFWAAARHRPGVAFGLGWLQGIVSHLLVLWWLFPAMRDVGDLSAPLALASLLALACFQGLRAALVAALIGRGTAINGWPLSWVAPAALVGVEAVFPQLFPWTTSLFVQAQPLWMQGAALAGGAAVSGWLAVVSAGVASAFSSTAPGTRPVRVAPLAVSALVVVAVTAAGVMRVRATDLRIAAAPTIRIGVVQGNLGPVRLERRDPVDVYRAASLTLVADQPPPELLVWPETAISFPVGEDDLPRFFRDVVLHDRREGVLAPRLDVPLLTGMVLADVKTPRRFNAAVLFARDRVAGIYRKRRLMPFGETSGAGAPFTAGPTPATLISFQGRRIGLSICYEDTFTSTYARAADGAAPELLVNLTSDAWFGSSPASALHLAAARQRAVEHGRFLLRATTTGGTAVVDPAGRVVGRLNDNQRASRVFALRWLSDETVYERLGETPASFALGLVAFAVVSRRRITNVPTPT